VRAQLAAFFKDVNIFRREFSPALRAPRFVVLPDQPRQVQRARQPRRTRTNDQYIRFELFALNAYLPASTITAISTSASSFSLSMAIAAF